MTKALITGASGFIGGHLVEALLNRGDELRCLVRPTSNLQYLPTERLELAYASLRDEEALRQAVAGVDVVYHLAAMTSAHRSADLMDANGQGSRRLAAACAECATPPVLVAVSSIAASGPIARGQIRTEADPPAPISHYGRSKLAGEHACREFAERVPITIVRAGIVFGPRNRELLPVFRTIRHFRIHPVPSFHPPPLSYVHVSDLIRLLIRCTDDAPRIGSSTATAESRRQGVYYSAMNEHPTYKEFGRILRTLLDRPRAPLVHLPASVAYPLAATNQLAARLRGRYDNFNIDKIREATASSWACSGEAACRDLDICITTPFQEQLRTTLQWYYEAGWL